MENGLTCSRCAEHQLPGKRHRVVRRGTFRRKHDGKVIKRFYCKDCGHTFSESTGTPTYGQHKPYLNVPVAIELSCSTAQRRIALKLGINRKTVARKLVFLGERARRAHNAWLKQRTLPISAVQFDDMESSEHTKLKPLSIPLIVEEKSRFILAWDVAVMPAKGRRAKVSRARYGRRPDLRPRAWHKVLGTIAPYAARNLHIISDSNPHYPGVIAKVLPLARHKKVKGRRACTVGQGEMKVGGWDPLFWLNHTAAMVRDNIKRLTRRTWCTTKRADRLLDHLAIYAVFHNFFLLKKRQNEVCPAPYRDAAVMLIG